MNKVFKVIRNEARNAYVVVSEIAKNHGSKSCSTKKLLAMLIATGVMTCASFDVLAAEPSGTDTAKSQYVAFADPTHTLYSGNKTTIDGHEYIYDATNKYWVRKGYKLVVEENGAMHTPLSDHGKSSDVAYIGNGDKDSILQSVASMVSASGTVTNMGESLNKITASGFVGVSHSGGTAVDGTWHYIIHDPTWEGAVAQGNYEDGYVDLVGKNMPKGFVTADDNKGLIWDDDKQAYNYKGKPVDYSNVYVIDGKIGVFTNKDGSDFYEGTVFGKNNEILMTVKDDNGHFYSYWASAVTDPSATMSTYRLAEYKKDLSVLVENDEKLSRNDIKEVTLDTTQANSATIGLLRNGDTEAGAPVKGAITVTSGGGTGGSGAANDTFVKISNGTANQTFATGSKVEAIGTKDATTGIKINGEAYTIKSGSVVSVKQNAAEKTTTITVDGKDTTITDTDTHNALDSAKLDGKKLTITGKDGDTASVDLSSIDTDTKYTAGNGIAISDKNAISVKLKEGENNLEVTAGGLALKKDLTVDSVQAGATTVNSTGLTIGTGDKGIVLSNSNVSMGGQQIHNVAAGTAENDAVNYGQLNTVNEVANKGWKVSTNGGTATDVKPGDTVDFAGEDNIVVSNTENKVVVKLGKDLTGLNSVTTNNAYVTNVDASKGDSVTNVEYVKNQITDAALSAGNGISITDKKINVKLKDGEKNLVVDNKGLAMNTALTGIESITAAGGTINLAGSAITINETTFNKDGRIQNVAEGTETKDAVNFGQLDATNKKVDNLTTEVGKGWTVATDNGTATKVGAGDTVKFSGADNNIKVSNDGTNVKVELNKELKGLNSVTTNNAYVTNVDASKGDSVTNVEYVKNQITDAALSAGNGISITDKKINVKLKDGEKNLVVDSNGLSLNTALTGIESITGAGAGSISFADGGIKLNNKVTIDNTGKITGVAAGNADTDAVNVSQLKDVEAKAGKHTQVKAGTNVSVVPGATADGTNVYTVNADGTTVSGDSNVVVTAGAKDENNVTNYGVKLNKNLQGIESVSNGSAKLTLSSHPFFGATAKLTNGQASVELMGGSTKINGKVEVRQDGSIGGVTAGRVDNDAVNLGQLKDVKAEAGKHTTLVAGDNVQVKEEKTDNGLKYTVSATDTTYTAGNGIAINGENNAISVKLKAGEGNLVVDKDGLALNKDLKGIESVSNGAAKLELSSNPIFGATAKLTNGKASVELRDSTTIINGKVQVRQDGSIGGVTAGRVDNDAVNLGQLKDVKAEAGKHTTLVAGDNVQVKEEKTDNGLKYTVSATDTTYTAGNGIAINGENNAISVKLKAGEGNLVVDKDGLALNKDLQGIASISNGDAKLTLGAMGGMVSEFANGQGASVKLFGDTTTINGKVNVYKDGRIAGVADGVNANDAVNVSQLQKVSDTANAGWNLSTNGAATEATNVKPGDNVDFSGDKNISVSNDGTKVKVELNKNLKDIESISNGDAKLTLVAMGGMVSEFTNGQGASVKLFGDTTTINGKVNVYKDGRIAGVADGVNATDAVNVSQLQKAAVASATTVSDGVNTTVTATKAEDGHTDYKVNLNKNLKDIETISNGGATLTLGAMGGMVSEFTNGQGASVKLFGDTTTINGKVNVYKDGRIAGVADGVNATDAVNVSQLQKAAAASATTVSNGVNTTVTATKAEDGHTDYKVNLNKDLVGIESISNGGASLTMNGFATELANGQGASVKLFGDTTTINGKVNVYKDGRIAGVADGINNNDAVNVGQLNKVSEIANKGWNLATNGVATEATNVKPGETVDFSGDKNISVSHDGTKVKVELNKDLDVNSVQTNALNSKYNLSVGTMAENGIMPFFVNSTGAFYAASNKFSVDKDGNMNANSVQTNALNSKYNLSVGTANENGIVPFFVNSNGAFYAANNNFSVDKDGKVIATAGEIGNVVLNNGVYTGHSALRDGELFVGDASGNYSQITTKGAKLGKVTIAEDGKISGVAAGEVSSTSTDAINGSQLHQTNENVAALDKRVTQNEADIATNKANIAQNAADIAANKANIAQNAADIATNKANIAQNAADIAQNKADIAQNKADIAQNKTDIKNLDNRVTNVEELAKKHTTVTAGDNITVTEDTNKDGGKEYKVALDKDIKLDSVTTGQTVMNNDGLKVGKDVSVTATAVTAGKTSISDEGVKVGDKTYISDKGLNANDQKVTNVAAGDISETSKDAVNGSQLYKTNQEVVNNTNRINQLGSRVNKVGAGAAALAALHPMDFDPDDKLTFSAGYGNYGGENAAAIGAYYRPDEKVMFSVGGTVGNGENMVNAGVSFSLDRTNHVSNSRTAMAREILDLRAEVTELKAMVAKGGLGSIAEDKMKIFPDVAENHWAYEYVGKLAAAGIIEGYPDGKFSGDRMMSRYEFAAMLYRAMQKGAQLDSKIINEFAPEMGRIRVDRISGEDGDRDKIERVRVNAVKGERDHYGNKIAKAEAKAK